MCKIKDKYTEAKTFTGYKIALKHKETGKYYSPSTGTVYRAGRRMRPLKKKVRDICQRWANPFVWQFFDSNMQGKTGVFVHFSDAIREKSQFKGLFDRGYDLCILKMTIKGGLYNAMFDSNQTIVGSQIVAIKEVH